uniref:Xanthine dehydrogenase n=1 Tax=Callorhinchus milii TaxID=7868 RepID=A0A4W3HJP4_CALMI
MFHPPPHLYLRIQGEYVGAIFEIGISGAKTRVRSIKGRDPKRKVITKWRSEAREAYKWPISLTISSRHFSLNACLAPVCSVHHMAVTTVEGIGSTDTQLHPVQERISKAHGSQCGFCTPGIVMSMYALVRNNLEPTIADIEDTLQGNLCRCTGYRPILEGYRTFTRVSLADDFNCNSFTNSPLLKALADTQLFESLTFKPLVPTQEPDFPPELLLFDELPQKTLLFKGERVTWIQPYSLDKLLSLKARYPEARLVVGNTEVGIEMKFKNQVYPVILAPAHIPELRFSRHTDTGILFGAACTLTYMERVLRRTVAELPAWRTEVFKAVLEQLRWFAGQQIRNVAVSSLRVWMDGGFFIGYRRTVLQPQEILLSIEIPFSRKGEYFSAFKQAQRREDDIAIVNCGMRVAFKEGSDIVEELSLSYGGMAATTISAEKTSQQLAGKKWNEKLLHEALPLLVADLPLSPSAPGGMVQFRRTLTLSFFFKFYLTVLQKLAKDLKNNVDIESIPLEHLSATELFHRDPPLALQLFQEVPPGQDPADVVGRPLAHLSAAKQATGEAVYCDDMPHFEKELYLTLVTSAKAHARIISVDTDEALKMAGVVCFISSKDIPGSNQIKIIKSDETVTCVGHIIGAVVADTQHHAQMAAKAIKVTYEELKPIITIQVIHSTSQSLITKLQNSQFGTSHNAHHAMLLTILTVLWFGIGEIHVGGQEHFYLETHCTVAVPKGEDGEMELFVSTQAPSNTQLLVAEALGVPSNRIVCRVKRLGGGFGGKESRSTLLALAVAVAAYKTKCPVRCMLNRDEDMLVTGGRHPFLGHYKVGFKDNGTIAALDVTCYCNAGNTFDLSPSVLERSLFHLDNSYMIPNFRGIGYLCKTNLASNTAFRGFGAPQGMIIAECWMNDIIMKCGLPAEQVRHLNLYQEGDTTHFNQRLDELSIGKCWEECLRNSHYHSRRKAVDEFNRQHRWKKRGLAIIPTKFGVSFGASFLNQAGALVLIYTDGSVLVTHGGTEMGQGLHTKMVQVASRVLGIPVCKIHISETSTNTVPNTSPTAASVSSDLNGMAIYNACQTLLERLKPFKEANPHGTWENWVDAAYMNTVSLSAVGFHRTPDLNYNWETNSGQAYNYFSYGVATSEVEIDCLTGDHKNLRTDIVMDVGTSLNPALDIGQVEGAFVQGLGLFTIEELRYSPDGVLYTRGPGTYKIPGFGDIPAELNVSLLRDSVNSKAIYSSKVTTFCGSAVFQGTANDITASLSDRQDLEGQTSHWGKGVIPLSSC